MRGWGEDECKEKAGKGGGGRGIVRSNNLSRPQLHLFCTHLTRKKETSAHGSTSLILFRWKVRSEVKKGRSKVMSWFNKNRRQIMSKCVDR